MVTKVEWCTHTENPFHGCRHNCGEWCYARNFAIRHGNNPNARTYYALKLAGLHPFEPAFSFDRFAAMIDQWERASKPRRIFLGSMGDLGGEFRYHSVRDDGVVLQHHMQAKHVREVILRTVRMLPQHTFLILTKNPCGLHGIDWPDNVHVGTSVTCTADALMRGETLEGVNARTRWFSVEPLIDELFDPDVLIQPLVRWVVIGAMTGRHAPKDQSNIIPAAARIVARCQANGIPVFAKDNLRALAPGAMWPRQLPA